MLDRLFGDDPPDDYVLLRTTEPKAVVDEFEPGDEPEDPVVLDFEYDLRPGVYELRERRGGTFRAQVWKTEVGNPRGARDDRDDRLDRLEQLVREQAESESRSWDEELREGVMRSVLRGDLDPRAARELAEINATWDGTGAGQSSLSDSVDDPRDLGEVGGRTVLSLIDDPSRAEELVERVSSAAASGLLGGDDAPAPATGSAPARPAGPETPDQPGHEAPDEPTAATDGGDRDRGGTASKLREQFDDDPDDAGDDDQPPEEMEEFEDDLEDVDGDDQDDADEGGA